MTDAIDMRSIDVILRQFYNPGILKDSYAFSRSGLYYSIAVNEAAPHKGYIEYIESLPTNAGPEVFSMDDNANITITVSGLTSALRVSAPMAGRWWRAGRGCCCKG